MKPEGAFVKPRRQYEKRRKAEYAYHFYYPVSKKKEVKSFSEQKSIVTVHDVGKFFGKV